MNTVFTLMYVNVDVPANSEVIGVYNCKDVAIDALLKAAHYSEKNGILYQYLERTDEYESFAALREQVKNDLFLVDEDIYRIMEVPYK